MAANDSLSERLIQAALRTAEEGNWRTTTVADLARTADVDPETAEARFSGRDDVLDALARQTDERVIAALDEEDFAAASPKERLLEALMCRLDVLAPHRSAFREFGSQALRCPNTAARTFGRIQTSMGNVLDAAGLAGGEFERAVRATALAYVWIRTCRWWLLDEEERGLDSVFAMLDQELSRIESLARCLEGFAPRNPA